MNFRRLTSVLAKAALSLSLAACSADFVHGVGTPTPPPDPNSTIFGGQGTPTPTPIATPLPDPALLSFAVAQMDFGDPSVNSYNFLSVTVKNEGETTATQLTWAALVAPFAFKDGPAPGRGGTCGATLGAKQSCALVISFVPVSLDMATSRITSTYNDGVASRTASLDLRGKGNDHAFLAYYESGATTPLSSIDFGTVVNAQVFQKNLTVRYAGLKPASQIQFALRPSTSAFSLVSNDCPSTLPRANGSLVCNLTLAYTGAGVVAGSGNVSHMGTLEVTYNNGEWGERQLMPLTGTTSGIPKAATLAFASGTNDAGRILNGTTKSITVVVNNDTTATQAATLSGITFTPAAGTGANDFALESTTCPPLKTVATCNVVVTFTASAGARQATLTLNYTNGLTSTVVPITTLVKGSGGAAAALTINQTSPNVFGTQPLNFTLSKTFTLSNAATNVAATVTAVTGLTGASVPFSYTGACARIEPGTSCSYTVKFKPVAADAFTAPLGITYQDGAMVASVAQTRSIDITLNGTGTNSAKLVVSTLNFGTVVIGGSSTLTGTLQFFGGSPGASQITFSGVSAPYSFTGGFPGGGTCAPTTASANCTFKITFTPTVRGAANSTVTVGWNDGSGAMQSTTFNLTGAGGNPSTLTPSLASYDFGNVILLSSKTQSPALVLTLGGDVPAKLITVSALSAPFSFQTQSCAATLSSGSCSIIPKFSPTSDVLSSATVTVQWHDGLITRSLSFALSGTGVRSASLSLAGFGFGKIPVGTMSSPHNVVLTNTGSTSATNVSLSSGPAAPFSVVTNGCGATLAAAASCNVSIRFSPSVPGTKSEPLTFSYQNAGSPVVTSANVTGTGIVPVLVRAHGEHTCVRQDIGQLKCWGDNRRGQLGNSNLSNNSGDAGGEVSASSASISFGAGHWVKEFGLGDWHTCAILENDELRCWGANGAGQLGSGSNADFISDPSSASALVILGNGGTAKPVSVVGGYAHTCVLLDNGKAKCFGDNTYGQLGQGNTQNVGRDATEMASLRPLDLGPIGIAELALNAGHSCARLMNGTVKCWGENFFGQLGQGDYVNRGDSLAAGHLMGASLPAVNLGSGRTATQVSAGGGFTCARLDDGGVKCWGRNQQGVLGNLFCLNELGIPGSCSDANYSIALHGYGIAPSHMPLLNKIDLGGQSALEIAAGTSSVCARLASGAVKCWGSNRFGQLGKNDIVSRGTDPSQMGAALTGISFFSASPAVPGSLAAGAFHMCAWFDAGVKCWGKNEFGALGLNDAVNRGDAATAGHRTPEDLPFIDFQL